MAVLSDNRFGFGVGVSPWPDDYRVLDLPWEKRGKRMDEAMQIVKGLCAGGWFEHHGEIYDVEPIKISPVPTAPIPMLVGGHSRPAMRRAVTLGDGWMHAGGNAEPALPRARLRDMVLQRRVLRHAQRVPPSVYRAHRTEK